MKARGKLTFECEDAGELVEIIEKALSPDNLSEMETIKDKNSFTVTFKADKIGTLISSVDDYLMNAIIVEKLSFTMGRG